MKKFLTTGLLTVMALPVLSGCQSIERNENAVVRSHHNEIVESGSTDFAEPEGIAAIWTDSTYQQAGEQPVRGFGARIFFTDAADNPVKVDGELTVYGFEESNQSDAADYKFVFRREELQSHYGENDIGHSYSIWIPWEPVGGFRKSVALIPVFKSANGTIVRGDQTINVLPGRNPETSTAEVEEQESGFSPIRTAGYDSSVDGGEAVRTVAHTETPLARVEASSSIPSTVGQNIRTTTISVPRHLANRMADLTAFEASLESGDGVNRVRHSGDLPADARDDDAGQAQNRQPSSSDSAEPVRRTRGDFVFGKPGPRG